MSRPKVVETVTASTMAELRRRRDAVTDADVIELRLDSVSDPDVASALAGRRKPVILTCRPAWEGGGFEGSEEERHRILREALAQGAEFVDIEWRARFDDLIAEAAGRRIVLSSHDYQSMPADLPGVVRSMRGTGAEVVKVAAKANRLSDCVPLLDVGRAFGRGSGLALIAMGDYGLSSRVLASRFESVWTYAGAIGSVGQLSASALIGAYRFRSITEATDVYGLVGSPIGHSVSPAMHNAAFKSARIDAVYLPLPAVDADDFIRFARAIGLKGASITIPFKVTLFDRVDEGDAVARRIGAINTIRVSDGRWLGGNTDASGFLAPLKDRGVALDGARVSILGAGGAARAVAIALASSGATISVHARTRSRAEEVAMMVSGRVGAWPAERGSWDVLINCTSVGMRPNLDESPVATEALTGRLVYDLVYNPPTTRLLREAIQAGLQTIGGLDMLVAQAHEQFHWWTDSRPPAGVMRAAAEKRLAEFNTNEDHVS
jgi:3-dehydroquinate dehydratase/shikimate dehydrogenase